MYLLLLIIAIIVCALLVLMVLIQNPKGGGLTGSFGSISSQVMGVKQSTDVMEKGTWTMISIIGGLCIISVMFFQKPQNINGNGKQQGHRGASAQQQSAPAKKAK